MHARTRHFRGRAPIWPIVNVVLQSPYFPNWFHKACARFAGLTSHSVARGGTALRVITHGGSRD